MRDSEILKSKTKHLFYTSMDNNVDGEIEDLLSYFEQELTLESSFPKICTPEMDLTPMHISGKIYIYIYIFTYLMSICILMNAFLFFLIAALPREILMYIFRWVVSSDLDMRALEQLSLVCRGFYICSRSELLS